MTNSSDLAKLRALVALKERCDKTRCPASIDPSEYDCGAPDCDCAKLVMQFNRDSYAAIPSLVSYIETAEKMRRWIRGAQHSALCPGAINGQAVTNPAICSCGLSALRAHLEDSV